MIPHPLDPAEFKRHCIRLHGRPGAWRKTVAEWLNVSVYTVDNWSKGRRAIPGPVVTCLRLLDILKTRDLLK